MIIEGATELERLVNRSRRIGSVSSLVLHGGGNTSTKLVETDHVGRERRVLRIKGSGSDLFRVTERDFPGLWLDDLLPLRVREAMTDEEMVAYLSRCLVEPDSPRPSIETLLHAFLPATHVDHVHADAICSLANAPDPEVAVHEALGDDVAVVPYLRPGFELSKRVAELADARAVVLAHHGLVTWGDTHDESYGLMHELVDRAAEFVGTPRTPPVVEPERELVERFLLRLRGRVSHERRQVLATGLGQQPYANRSDVDVLASMRSTPDHMLRIAGRSCVVDLDGDLDSVEGDARVFLVQGFGVVAAAPDAKAARQRVEIAEHTHASVAATLDRFGSASWLTPEEVRDFEQWPLELHKLTLLPPAPELQGHVVLVTGGASGIGREIAHDLARRGAELVVVDRDEDGLEALDVDCLRIANDLTEHWVIDPIVHRVVASYGGLDAVVFNAGIASSAPLDELADEEWNRTLAVNLSAPFALTRRVLGVMKEQGIRGSLVYVASKNAFAPGAGFGPYSVSKAGLVQLMRIAALEGGPHGIRANAVNPDAIFTGSKLWSPEIRKQRADAHGVEVDELEAFYASRSLLGRAVTGGDVAEAVAFLVSDRSRSTTGAVVPVDGGSPGAFPR